MNNCLAGTTTTNSVVLKLRVDDNGSTTFFIRQRNKGEAGGYQRIPLLHKRLLL